MQLMILVSARLATMQFVWFIHEPYAVKEGISSDIVEAIRERRSPNFTQEDEHLVYDVTLELNTTLTLSEATYTRGIAMFGAEKMVELVAAVGFYVMVAMTLSAFDVPVPGKNPLRDARQDN